MKKIVTALTICALLVIAVFSCKKNTNEDPNLTYIKDFYGVNVPHSFVCPNPTNDQKSLKVDLVWDEKGIVNYTTTEIPKDTSERNSIIFMPSSEFNPDNGIITPTTKAVRKIALVNLNGSIEPVDNLNCVNGSWNCGGYNNSCTGSIHTILTTVSVNNISYTYPSVVCGTSNCPATWVCNGLQLQPLVVYYTW